ncbi:MAG: hypothetical protein GY832_40625 [Chloroflexi bacterium]|nr:hypothetical protein [Chloroflexota bacterium]
MNNWFLQRRVWGEQFDKWLVELREKEWVEQRKIARCIGKSPSLLSKWKAGQGTPEAHAKNLTSCLQAKGLSLRANDILDWWALVGYWPSEEDIQRWDSEWKPPKVVTLEMQTIGLQWDLYVEREEYATSLRRMLLEERGFREPAVKRVCMWGMGGSGKTVLAKSMALNDQVQRYFRDGVLWAELGPEGNAALWLQQWCELLGLSVGKNQSVWVLSEKAKTHLATTERRYLIVVDDAWRAKDVEPLLVDGPQSRVLITSRDRELASKLDPRMVLVPLDVMSQQEALTLLQRRTTPERWRELEIGRQARELLELVEGLPLAIALIADVVNTRGCGYALTRLRDESLRLELLEKDKIERREHSIRMALNVSYEAQSAANQRLFRWLSVFSYDGGFSSLMVARLLSEENIQRIEERLRRLLDSSLLLSSYTDVWGKVRFRLHLLLHDYGREKLQTAGEWDLAIKQYIATYAWLAQMCHELLGQGIPDLEKAWQVEVSNVVQALVHARDLDWWNDIAVILYSVDRNQRRPK